LPSASTLSCDLRTPFGKSLKLPLGLRDFNDGMRV